MQGRFPFFPKSLGQGLSGGMRAESPWGFLALARPVRGNQGRFPLFGFFLLFIYLFIFYWPNPPLGFLKLLGQGGGNQGRFPLFWVFIFFFFFFVVANARPGGIRADSPVLGFFFVFLFFLCLQMLGQGESGQNSPSFGFFFFFFFVVANARPGGIRADSPCFGGAI